KAALLERALGDLADPEFVRFLQAVVRRGRQGLVGEIAQQYHTLVDEKLNRVHAGVTLLQEPDARLEKEVIERLSQTIGKEVRAHFRADRDILGGVVGRVGGRSSPSPTAPIRAARRASFSCRPWSPNLAPAARSMPTSPRSAHRSPSATSPSAPIGIVAARLRRSSCTRPRPRRRLRSFPVPKRTR